MGGTALGASGRSNNGLKLDVKTGKLSLWRLFPTFTFTFVSTLDRSEHHLQYCVTLHCWHRRSPTTSLPQPVQHGMYLWCCSPAFRCLDKPTGMLCHLSMGTFSHRGIAYMRRQAVPPACHALVSSPLWLGQPPDALHGSMSFSDDASTALALCVWRCPGSVSFLEQHECLQHQRGAPWVRQTLGNIRTC